MTKANDSILVTPGSGATVATHLISSKEHQVVMLAHANGHLLTDQPLYFFNIASAVHVAAASTQFWDIFNAHSSLIVRVLMIQHIVNLETAVTGVGFEWQLLRTTAIGTGGTAQTAWPADTTQTDIEVGSPIEITCRLKPTGGGTASTSLRWYYTHSEETQAGNQLAGGGYDGMNIVPRILTDTGKGIVLRQNQGLRLNQETNSAAGNSAFLIGFSVE